MRSAVAVLPGWEIVAVADADAAARQRVGALVPRAQLFGDLSSLAEASTLPAGKVELIVLATPPVATPTLLAEVLSHNGFETAAVLVEKPGALTEQELQPARLIAARRLAPVHVAYSYRQHGTVHAFTKALPQLGALHELTLDFHAPFAVSGWRAARATGGGALRDIGAHLIDLARGMIPGDWSLEHAEFQSRSTEHDAVQLRYRAGATRLCLRASYHGRPVFSIVAAGAAGRLSCDLWSHTTPSRSALGALWSRLNTAAVPAKRAGPLLREAYASTLRRALANAHTPEGAIGPASLDDAVAVLRYITEAETGCS